MIFTLIFSFFFLNAVSGSCPTGTVSDPYSNNWKCLAFTTPGKLYLPADNFCGDEYHGHLVSIENAFVNLFITQIADTSFANETSKRFWVGTNNISGSGWTNIDGSTSTYLNWAPGEPAAATGSNGCVSVDLQGLWYNDECFNTYPYVCEIPEAGTVPTQPNGPTTPVTGSPTIVTDATVSPTNKDETTMTESAPTAPGGSTTSS